MSSYTFTQLGSFSNDLGANPVGRLVEDSAGNVFGTCRNGGVGGNGTIFKWDHSTGTLTTLASFDGANGFAPTGLSIDGSGNLFGEAGGGAGGVGEIFEIAAGSTTIQILATFGPNDGVNPVGGLTLGSGGNLFGVTSLGGPPDAFGHAGQGTVFELAKGSSTITTLATFYGGPLQHPSSNLILINGALYGAAGDQSGFGGIFKENAGTITELASLDDFPGLGDTGSQPVGNIVRNSQGDLLGEASNGGIPLVWDLPSGGNSIHPLVALPTNGGPNTDTGVAFDPNGNLFGTFESGVFQIPTGGTSIVKIPTGGTGSSNSSPLLIDAAGNIFGVCDAGGDNGIGTLWQLSPDTSGGGTTGGRGNPSGLTASLAGKFPASVLPGGKTAISATTTITNTLSTSVSGSVQVALYLSSGSTVDSNSILLGTKSRKVRLKPNQKIAVPEKVSEVPATVPLGTYNLVVQVTDPTGNTVDAVAAQTITVAPAHIDLTAAFVKIPSGKAGRKGALTISVTNGGNLSETTPLPIVVSASTSGQLADATQVGAITRPVNIKPGTSIKLTISLTLPAAPGSYFFIVHFDPDNTIANLTDDGTFVSTTSGTVG